ncbi:MAG: hypothetical protein ACNA7X_05030 [Dehalococcoidia bacterium]
MTPLKDSAARVLAVEWIARMDIKPGVPVFDKNGKELGSVTHLARDGWSGEVKKFIITTPDKDLFFSVDDVAEATDTVIRLNVALEE